MDPVTSTLTVEMMKAIGEGNVMKFGAYLVIFVVIWLEVRGLKKEVAKLSQTIGHSFDEGEKRFDRIEGSVKDIEHRLTVIETTTTSQGGTHGNHHEGTLAGV